MPSALQLSDDGLGFELCGVVQLGCMCQIVLLFSSSFLSSLELSDERVYASSIRALFGTAAHLFNAVVLMPLL